MGHLGSKGNTESVSGPFPWQHLHCHQGRENLSASPGGLERKSRPSRPRCALTQALAWHQQLPAHCSCSWPSSSPCQLLSLLLLFSRSSLQLWHKQKRRLRNWFQGLAELQSRTPLCSLLAPPSPQPRHALGKPRVPFSFFRAPQSLLTHPVPLEPPPPSACATSLSPQCHHGPLLPHSLSPSSTSRSPSLQCHPSSAP